MSRSKNRICRAKNEYGGISHPALIKKGGYKRRRLANDGVHALSFQKRLVHREPTVVSNVIQRMYQRREVDSARGVDWNEADTDGAFSPRIERNGGRCVQLDVLEIDIDQIGRQATDAVWVNIVATGEQICRFVGHAKIFSTNRC